MSRAHPRSTVLVVDDEPDVADAYALRLEERYDVRTAYGGAEALETIDDQVHVVLLDRRMPELSGDEVLAALRERGHDCGVIMVTAVDPDFDIIEMPFDDYLQKPVDRDTLFDAIDEQLAALDRDAAVSELFAVTAKVGVLEQRKSEAELRDNPEYQELTARAAELREEIHGDDSVDATDVQGPAHGAPADGTGAVASGGAGAGVGSGGTVEGDEAGSSGLLGRILGLFGG